MYEQHFGLHKPPFRTKAAGKEVFVGPQTAKTMAGFRKALAAQDAVVTVSGLVGTGKTTLVERALDAIGTKYKTIRVGRMEMNSSDVLEALLIVLGVQDRPSGTIQRFAALRRKLRELQDRDVRVFILVEDGLRTGAETLAELEALTDAEAGESDGAAIVVMGDERLPEFMQSPQLARLQQRVRQRHTILPLCVAELRGYLLHSFRLAGVEFEQLFGSRAPELLHLLSAGIPRIVNNLVESTLAAAAAEGIERIPTSFIANVASDEYGLNSEDFDFEAPAPAVPVAEDAAQVEPAAENAPQPEPVAEAALEPEPVAENAPKPEPVAAAAPEPEPVADNAPRPEPVAAAAPEPEPIVENAPHPEPVAEAALEPEPVAAAAAAPEPEPIVENAPQPEPVAELAPPRILENVKEPAAEEVKVPPPAIDLADKSADAPVESEGALDLGHDSLPDLAILSPRFALPQEDDEEGTPELAAAPEPVVNVSPDPEPSPEPEPEPAAEAVAELEPLPKPEPVAEATPDPEPLPEPEPEPVPLVIPELKPLKEPDPEPVAPAISKLEPLTESTPETELIAKAVPDVEPLPEPELALESDYELESEFEVVDETAPEPEAAPDLVPEALVADTTSAWDSDSTLSELEPDLEALEKAMAVAHGKAVDEKPEERTEAGGLLDGVVEKEEIPEITLDKSIETGIQNQLREGPEDSTAPKIEEKRNVELDRIAANLGKDATLDDIDDKMAETLFGNSFSMIAAQLSANPPIDESANDALQLDPDDLAMKAPATGTPLVSAMADEVSLETRKPSGSSAIELTASQRLKTVRALSADLHPSMREPEAPPRTGIAQESPANDAPAPIEDQINTSISQTLEALDDPADHIDEDDEESKKSGFFSRFRR